MLVLYAIFSENLWFQTKRFTGLLKLIQDNFFIFTTYQNYTLALSIDLMMNVNVIHNINLYIIFSFGCIE